MLHMSEGLFHARVSVKKRSQRLVLCTERNDSGKVQDFNIHSNEGFSILRSIFTSVFSFLHTQTSIFSCINKEEHSDLFKLSKESKCLLWHDSSGIKLEATKACEPLPNSPCYLSCTPPTSLHFSLILQIHTKETVGIFFIFHCIFIIRHTY